MRPSDFRDTDVPGGFPFGSRHVQEASENLLSAFSRAFPSAGFHWKLEFQARGAAHFHPIFWNLSGDDGGFLREFRGWLAQNWSEVVHSGDEKHLLAGTSADPIKSQFGIIRYVSGYASKSDQTKPGCKVGRYWGIVGRANIPWAKEHVIRLSAAQAKLVRRTQAVHAGDEPGATDSDVWKHCCLGRCAPRSCLTGIFAGFENDALTQKYFSSCLASFG